MGDDHEGIQELVLLSALMGIAACGGQVSPGPAPVSSSRIIITNGTVVDGRGSEPIRDGIVVIVEDRIAFVGKAADYTDRAHAQVIDARGGTILPGIIDAHVHGGSDPAIRREFLIGGVTAVCDLGFPLEAMARFDQDHLGQDPVARGFRAGPILTTPGGLPGAALHENVNYEVGTPDEARAAVVDLYNRGADIIKVYLHAEDGEVTYPMLGKEELAAIVQEAHAHGLLVRAHVAFASLLSMAVRAGVDTIEHVPVNVTQEEYQSMPESQWQGLLESNDPLQVFFAEIYPPANVCGHGSELGTLEPGKLADVIVEDGDPLQDLRAMSRVVLVIKNGEIAVISEEILSADE